MNKKKILLLTIPLLIFSNIIKVKADTINVSNEEELKECIENGNTCNLSNDINVNDNIEIIETKVSILNLNGYKLYLIDKGLDIKGFLTINNTKNEGEILTDGHGKFIINQGKLTLNNINIKVTDYNGECPISSGILFWGQGNLVINGGIFDTTAIENCIYNDAISFISGKLIIDKLTVKSNSYFTISTGIEDSEKKVEVKISNSSFYSKVGFLAADNSNVIIDNINTFPSRQLDELDKGLLINHNSTAEIINGNFNSQVFILDNSNIKIYGGNFKGGVHAENSLLEIYDGNFEENSHSFLGCALSLLINKKEYISKIYGGKYKLKNGNKGGICVYSEEYPIKVTDLLSEGYSFSPSETYFHDGYEDETTKMYSSITEKEVTVIKNSSIVNENNTSQNENNTQSKKEDKTTNAETNKPNREENKPKESATSTNTKSNNEITKSPDTGDVLIYLAWFIGLGAISYSIYYFRSIKTQKAEN